MRRPNVLLVVLDAARRDALEPYGAPPGSTPTIAQIANRGAALPDVHATGCWTVPSHASMFTGLMPRAAGLARAASPSAAKPVVARHLDRLLPEVLRRVGYSTWGASANLWVSPHSGFTTGFDDFAEVYTGRNASLDNTGRRERLSWLIEAARGAADDGARAVAERIGARLSRDDDRPFFGFVNLLECHSPYLPPRPYGGSVRERLRAAEDARRYYTLQDIWRACGGVLEVPEPTLARLRRMYAASVRYMDDWLAGVIEQIDAAGMLAETVLIVCSDHGENFGENGLIAHALSLDERLLHVPFVVAGPGTDGRAITSMADLPRFVAETVDLDDHPWHDGPAPGVGVAQLDPPLLTDDDGSGAAALRDLGLASAHDLFTTPQTCAVAGGLKLLRRGLNEQVYDLASDPLESAPLPVGDGRLAGREDELRLLREALDHPAMAASASAAAAEPEPSEISEQETRDLEERMRLLGYM